jgi:hypothetical protein
VSGARFVPTRRLTPTALAVALQVAMPSLKLTGTLSASSQSSSIQSTALVRASQGKFRHGILQGVLGCVVLAVMRSLAKEAFLRSITACRKAADIMQALSLMLLKHSLLFWYDGESCCDEMSNSD